jgi:hypothetical protein
MLPIGSEKNRAPVMRHAMRRVAVGLQGVCVSLLLVGLLSGTPLRHLVQIAPGAAVLAALSLHARWAAAAALAFLQFWLMMMFACWAYLLGLPSLLGGVFTPAEIVLTVAIGAFAVWGAAASLREKSEATLAARAAAFIATFVLQAVVFAASMQPFFAHR